MAAPNRINDDPCFQLNQLSYKVNQELNALHAERRECENLVKTADEDIASLEAEISQLNDERAAACRPTIPIGRSRSGGQRDVARDIAENTLCAEITRRATARIRDLRRKIEETKKRREGCRASYERILRKIKSKDDLQEDIGKQQIELGCR